MMWMQIDERNESVNRFIRHIGLFFNTLQLAVRPESIKEKLVLPRQRNEALKPGQARWHHRLRSPCF